MTNLRLIRLLRVVALVILTICLNQAHAQTHTPKYISMGPNTNGYYEYLPQGYDPNVAYPVIIFIHGIGELGNGTDNLQSLLNTGLPGIIAWGQFPAGGFNVNGQNFKFIVISPQFIQWPSASDVDGVINYVTGHYRVNTSRIYLTGLSMGGGAVWDYAGSSSTYASRLTAIIPICGASWPDYNKGRVIANANLPVWAIHNNGDPTVPVTYTNDYISYINQSPSPNPTAQKSLYDVWSHDAWTNAYNGTDRDGSGRNIFEWMLSYSKGSSTPPSNNQPPVANAGWDQSITGTSVQMNGSGIDPDGSITSYTWSQVSGPSQFSFNNPVIANPVVSNLTAGSYTFRLTVKDNAGATAYDDVVINVSASAASIPGTIQAESYSAMSGIQVENTYDAGGGQNVGWQDNGDWMDYQVNVATAGNYKVDFRVATMFNGPQFQVRNSSGNVLATVNVPNTSSFQSWQTVSATVALPAGQQTLRIYTSNANGGWNFNYMSFAQAAAANQSPIAAAGSAQTITLPVSSVALSGSGSDPDGWVASYSWSQVSGPSNASFGSAGSAATTVSGLLQGSYTFRLTVTDNAGAFSTSDVTITVNAAGGSTSGGSIRIEAENFTSMSGIQTENTYDAGGGQNVGWQDNNDWMDYSVNVSSAGNYTVNFRVASMFSGAQFQLRDANGYVMTTVTVPNTGSFQTWQTVSAQVNLAAGQQTIRIVTTQANGGWNINWWEIQGAQTTSVTATSIKIEAENFSSMSGIQTENTYDAGGGLNVGWQDNNDWMDYSVNVSSAGTYTVNFRVATMFNGPQFQLRDANGYVLATVNVPNTGWFQTWQTVSAQVSLPAGQQTLRIVTTQANGGWNINWWEITNLSGTRTQAVNTAEVVSTPVSGVLNLYPNPVQDRFSLQVNNDLTGAMKVQVYNMSGVVQKQFSLNKASKGATQTYLSIGSLPKGEYVIKVSIGKWTDAKKLVKL